MNQVHQRIGPYRVLQVLGEGGMGTVYEVEQTGAMRRRVALKVIRPGMDTKQVVARFEVERQALAVMDHPNIAKVYDAGVTHDGRPYFAMELVQGIPVNEYCDVNRLGVRDRLKLFVPICSAVQHAHHKGVIHRDLKPSNLLVTDQGGRAEPKIIDFGVAKATGRQLTERTIITQHGMALGTLAYMSPEQAEMSGLDVDTRADVYSLGVILYELLVGELPIDPQGATPAEFIARLVQRDTIPPLPSARIDTLRNASSVAINRGVDLRSLRRSLRGDLDWIILRAMDHNRSRRYQTVNALALDVQRHLADEPVMAGPPSTWYRVRKFVRRNRVVVTAAGLVTASLAAGLVLTTAALSRARAAETLAADEAAAATQVSDFLVGLFGASDPASVPAANLTAPELLERGVLSVRSTLANQPLILAKVLHAIAHAYHGMGRFDESAAIFREALDIRERELGTVDLVIAGNQISLANALRVRGVFAEADSLFEVVSATYDALQDGPTPPSQMQVGHLANNWALLASEVGRVSEAESLLTKATMIFEQELGPQDTLYAKGLSNLSTIFMRQGEFARAESTLTRSLAINRAQLPNDHPLIADVLNNLGVTYWYLGDYDRAADYYSQTLEIYQRTYGPDHLLTGSALNNVGETFWSQGHWDEAESYLRRALATKIRAVGPDHTTVGSTTAILANTLRDAGKHGEAESQYRRALVIYEGAFGRNSPALLSIIGDYVDLLQRMGRERDAANLEARADSIENAGGS